MKIRSRMGAMLAMAALAGMARTTGDALPITRAAPDLAPRKKSVSAGREPMAGRLRRHVVDQSKIDAAKAKRSRKAEKRLRDAQRGGIGE